MPTLKDLTTQSLKLSEEERRRKMLLAMQDQMTPQYKYDVNATPQSTETIQEPAGPDMSGYAQTRSLTEDSGVYGAGPQTEVTPLEGDTKGRFKDWVGRTFGPNDVQWTGNGYRVKSWADRSQQQKQAYADTAPQLPARTRTVPTYTDANIKSTMTRPGMDMTNPQDIGKMSAYLASQGEKPESYGMPKLSDAVQLPGQIEARKAQTERMKAGNVPIDKQIAIQSVLEAHGMSYDLNASPKDNMNNALKSVDPVKRSVLLKDLNSGMKSGGNGQYAEAKDLAGLDQKVEGMVAKSVGLKFGKDAIVYDPMTESWQFPPNFQGDRQAVMNYAESTRKQYQQRYGVKAVGEEGKTVKSPQAQQTPPGAYVGVDNKTGKKVFKDAQGNLYRED